MKLLKIFGFTLFIMLLTAAVPLQDQYIAKIAVVDVEALESSLVMTNIRQSMTELGEKIQMEGIDKEKEFKKHEEELMEQRPNITQEKFEALVSEFDKDFSVAKKNIQLKRHALSQAYSQAIETVHKTTISVISDLAKQYNFNIVLPSSQVLFVTNELNITHEVISGLNNKLKTVQINYEEFLK